MEGFITLHRKLLEWEWYDHTNTKVLFIHCLLKANHKPAKWRGFDIKRGEFRTSISNLSKETGLTIKQVRIALDNLVKTGELGKQTTSVNTTISVLKYDNYQTKGKPSDKLRANQGQGKGKVGATTNNDNNEENDNNEKKKQMFEVFWNLYDKKVDRKKSLAIWNKLSEDEMNAIIKAVPTYVQNTPDIQYRKLPTTYLNGRNWEDEIKSYNKNSRTSHVHIEKKTTESDFVDINNL